MARVAYVSADLGVPVFGRKGCSIHVQEVLAAMLRAGAEVDLFSTKVEGEPAPELKRVRVHQLPNPPKGDPAVREQAALAGNEVLRNALAAAGPFDFIYERYSLWSYGAMEFARDTGVPGLIEVNAPLIEEQARYRVLIDNAAANQVAARAFQAANWLLAVSHELVPWLDQFPGARGKVQVVPNGIRPERFPPNLAPALPADAGAFTVGFVGTLKAWHGIPILLEAFASFRRRHPNSRLLIVGDGPQREALEQEIANRGLEAGAVLTGAVPPEQIPALLASMNVAVAPYPALEHFYFSPLKVYEYMAAGLPVVASRIGQLEQLIQSGSNGLLVTPGDAAALECALEWLADDADLRARLGRAARATVLSHHTWDAVARRIFRLAASVPRAGASALANR